MTAEEIIKEIEAMHILEFINFLDKFESSSTIGNLLVEDWRKKKCNEYRGLETKGY